MLLHKQVFFLYSFTDCNSQVTYPLDVLRRKMQMQGFNMEQVKYRNTYECMVYTFKVDGWKGFYKGLWPNYLKVVPSISISFVVYEKVKDMLGG